jgi:hypothetical protein
MKKILVCFAVLGLFCCGCSDSKPDLREGKWQVSAQMDMAGVPFKMPPMVYEVCLSQKDIVPTDKTQQSNCKLVGPKIKGNTVSWTSTCQQEDGSPATSNGSITYAGETFTGTISVKITGDQPMDVLNTLTGKYLGACK